MAPSRPSSLVVRLTALSLVGILSLQPLATFAAKPVSTAKIREANAEADKVRRHIDDLAAEAEVRNEDYEAAAESLQRTERQVKQAERDVHEAEAQLAVAQDRLRRRARAMYTGGRPNFIAVLLGAQDFADFSKRVDFLTLISVGDAAAVAQVEQAKAQAEKSSARLANRREEQAAFAKRSAERKAAVAEALQSQKDYLSKLDGRIAKLVAEERERQQREAEAAARRLAKQQAAERARRAAAARAAEVARKAAEHNSPDPEPQDETPAPPSGSGHAAAVSVARRYVGVTPYVWGGTSPSGFDCSGLTQYSYRQIGISIPRTSRSQFTIGTHISRNRTDLLEPGDLVFFGTNGDVSRIHHVGIYAGDGLFVHAPQTGMRVSVSSLFARIRDRGDYVGAVRP